jgi:hypothetical protein
LSRPAPSTEEAAPGAIFVSELTGADLLPSYDYFRIYHGGDICRVHSDRPPCEHSMSLTLVYGDGKPWPLEIGSIPVKVESPCVDSFGSEPFTAVEMQPGDAVLYRGIDLRHGRTQPNPNAWSAHIFLFWVERGGPFEEHAFDAHETRQQSGRLSGVADGPGNFRQARQVDQACDPAIFMSGGPPLWSQRAASLATRAKSGWSRGWRARGSSTLPPNCSPPTRS